MTQETAPPQRASGRLAGPLRPMIVVLVYLVSWLVLDVATENLRGQLAISLWFPPAGLNVALLLIFGARYAPAVVLTTLVHYLLFRGGTEYPIWLLVVLPVLYTAVYAGAAALLVRVFKMDPRLSRMRDVLYFVGVGCLAAPLLASAVALTGYAIGEQVPWSGFVINTLGGWAGEATGVGVVATVLLIGLRPFPTLWSSLPERSPEEGLPRTSPAGFRLPERREIPELLGQAVLLAVAVFVAYGTERGVRLDFAYLVFLPLIWVALRGDLARTMLCVLIINVGAVILVGGVVSNTNPILIQFGLATLTIVGLLLGGLVNERRETSARLIHEASHDRLTGLPNRAPFLDILSEVLDRSPGGGFMVVVLDLDRFANINNALGHETGDKLLMAVGERLQDFADASEDFSVTRASRIGGDAFAVLIQGSEVRSRPGHVAERLLEELALPYEYRGDEVYATASAGAVLVDGAVQDAEELLRNADTALQSAKSKGPSRYEIFDEKLGAAVRERLELDSDLRRAVERGELVLYYQPVFSLETHTVVGAEALVRWDHPARGLLSPDEFIPLAEQSGLIVSLGDWIIREACRQARRWQETDPSQPPIVVSINLSAKQLERPGLSDEIHAALEETGLDPRMLAVEITENALVDSAESVRNALQSLREDGGRLAVDDFGTGYSSLSYLSRFPVDIIKIDRSFITRLSQGSGAREGSADEKLVSGIIDLVHNQNMSVVAEGVEDARQLERLKELGCDMVQGYHLSEPLPGERVLDSSRLSPGRRRSG